MVTKQVLEIVADFQSWRGDTYTLAALVAEAQKESDAKIAEKNGATATATEIRGN